MDITATIAAALGVRKNQVDAAVKLIDEGNTIPFIARYRKEATGVLNDEQLRNLFERLTYLRNLEEKKEQVIATIEEQGKLTEELKAQILSRILRFRTYRNNGSPHRKGCARLPHGHQDNQGIPDRTRGSSYPQNTCCHEKSSRC